MYAQWKFAEHYRHYQSMLSNPVAFWLLDGDTSRTAACHVGSMSIDTHHTQHRLMVVDNDHDLVDALCEWIGLSSDWTAVPAYGPAEAIAQATTAPPDAILLGMEMQDADGFETAERLGRASGAKHSAIVALTGNAYLRDAALLDPRFTASMLKPADPGRLLVLLSGLLPAH
jgi:CheY-like chemotaxis protein